MRIGPEPMLRFPMRWPSADRECDADIYHSQYPSLAPYPPLRAMPAHRRIATFRDAKELKDCWLELTTPTSARHKCCSTGPMKMDPWLTAP
jgi:hypothetical protein